MRMAHGYFEVLVLTMQMDTKATGQDTANPSLRRIDASSSVPVSSRRNQIPFEN